MTCNTRSAQQSLERTRKVVADCLPNVLPAQVSRSLKANARKHGRKYALYVLAVTHRLAIRSSDRGAQTQLAT